MSRVLLNEERVALFVRKNFVTAAGAVEELQRGRWGAHADSSEARWFEPIARSAITKFAPQFFKKFKSYQGIYIIDPDGSAYDYKIGLAYDPDHFLKELKKSLNKYRLRHKAGSAKIANLQGDKTSKKVMAPNSVSVIEVYSRIVPLPKDATISERSIGRDLMWVYERDVSDVLNTASSIGKSVKMPPRLVARLVRFHLLNHVGNIMRAFDAKDVRKAEFVLRRNKDILFSGKPLRRFSFSGSFSSSGKYEKKKVHSIIGIISGEFTIDPKRKRIVHFRAYGEGESLGGNDSLNEFKNYPVVFAMTESRHKYARSVIPFWVALPSIKKVYENPSISTQ